MDDYTESRLEDFIQKSGRDVTVEQVEPAFKDKLELVEERAMEDLDDQQKVDYAVSMLSSEDIRNRRVGLSGTETELKILAVGHRGVFPNWGKQDVDTVFAHAVVHGPLPDENGDPGEPRAAKAVLFNKETNMDLLEVQSKFHAGNTIRAAYDVEQAWDLNGFYRAYSTEDTDLVEEEFDDLPSSRDEKNEMLRKMFPDVALDDLAEDGEGLSSYDAESGYTNDWGADIQRFTGTVTDYYIPDDRSWGVMTLMDDSVTEEDLEGTDVIGDEQNIPGLSIYAQPDYHMNYGNGSILDVYGVIETNNDGQIVMRAAGVVPVIPIDMDDDDSADEGVDATESQI